MVLQTVSLDATMNSLTDFSQISGLKINADKTYVHKLGSLLTNNDHIETTNQLNWTDNPLCTLGIKIPIGNMKDIFNMNYIPQIEQMEINFKQWNKRKMSLRGKVTIIKTYGTSKLVYLAAILPNPPQLIINKINQLIFKFLWNDTEDKIKRDIMVSSLERGGLAVPHFQTICQSQKIAWVKRYSSSDENCQWGKMVRNILESLGGDLIFKTNLNDGHMKYLVLKSSFWKDVLTCWCLFNYANNINNNEILSQIIWLNSNVRVETSPYTICLV